MVCIPGTKLSIENIGGVFKLLKQQLIDWKYHISYVCAKLSRNTGVISKLRHYLPLKQLTQIYYNLIYPYISYAIVAWGSTNKTNLHEIQTKSCYWVNVDSALPLLNTLEMLTVANVYRLYAIKFIHAWLKGVLPELLKVIPLKLFHYQTFFET